MEMGEGVARVEGVSSDPPLRGSLFDSVRSKLDQIFECCQTNYPPPPPLHGDIDRQNLRPTKSKSIEKRFFVLQQSNGIFSRLIVFIFVVPKSHCASSSSSLSLLFK